MGWRAVAAVVVVLGWSASPASGATVYYEPEDEDLDTYATVWDEGRERNRLTVTYDYKTGFLRVVERGRPRLVAEDGCRQRAPRIVSCRMTPDADVNIDAGKGADEVRTRGLMFWVDGGGGDDSLMIPRASYVNGGPGMDRVAGGRDGDRLMGGHGRDTVLGRGGDDLLFGDGDGTVLAFTGEEPFDDQQAAYRRGHAADVLDGGRGNDTVTFVDHVPGVHVDLAAGTGPEGDRLRAVENVSGGMGNDVLRGDGGPNNVIGHSGQDRLLGRGGADVLDGREGEYSRHPKQDRFECGGGLDLVREHEFSPLPFSCEQLGHGDWRYGRERRVRAHLRPVDDRHVAVATVCPERRNRCDVRVTLSDRRVALGRGEGTRAPGVHRVVVRLERPLPKKRIVTIAVETKPRGTENWYYPDQWRIRCAGPPACRPY